MRYTILITNIWLRTPSGTTLYVHDLALALQRRGHLPVVLTLETGAISDRLRAAGIQVVSRLEQLRARPDLIHGHHFAVTMAALQFFPDVPALYICHDHTNSLDHTPLHPRILRYCGVSQLCVDRLLREGAPPERTQLIANFVDTARFMPRVPLPAQPRRALMFSNYAHHTTYLPAIEAACRRSGLTLDVVGSGVGNAVADPEHLLGDYDIVFAKGKSALEAMAVGAAVVLCDFGGVGPLVTTANLDALRPLNFGFQALRQPLSAETLMAEIARYDAADAARVRDQIRATASLDHAVDRLLETYAALLAEHRERAVAPPERRAAFSLTRQRIFARLVRVWVLLTPGRRDALKRLPVIGPLLRALKQMLFRNA